VEIAKVGVVGCGTMGSGICEVVARAGVPVSFVEISLNASRRGWSASAPRSTGR
jgi:3-hydroxybutyryl-CoA dehydrogenase